MDFEDLALRSEEWRTEIDALPEQLKRSAKKVTTIQTRLGQCRCELYWIIPLKAMNGLACWRRRTTHLSKSHPCASLTGAIPNQLISRKSLRRADWCCYFRTGEEPSRFVPDLLKMTKTPSETSRKHFPDDSAPPVGSVDCYRWRYSKVNLPHIKRFIFRFFGAILSHFQF